MSSAIQSALQNLESKIGRLEGAVETARKRKSGQPPDLFSVVGGQAIKKPANAVDAKMLATRLDTAISKVEALLKEGQG